MQSGTTKVPCPTGGPAAGAAFVWIGRSNVGKPAGSHRRTKLIPQVINGFINGFGNSSSFVLPQVIGYSKILTNLSDLTIIRIIL
jgi:hypothetical protein